MIEFDEPLDRAMLDHAIQVVGPAGNRIDGQIRVDEQETRWEFRPAVKWHAGVHQLQIDPTLEDLAGNSPGRPFEVGPDTAQSFSAGQSILEFKIHKQ